MKVPLIFSKLLIVSSVVLFIGIGVFFGYKYFAPKTVDDRLENKVSMESFNPFNTGDKNNATTSVSGLKLEEYRGPIRHVFFHSLIIYPEKAVADTKNIAGYKDYMITVEQFKQIVQQLHDNNFVLINSDSLYSFDKNGYIQQNKLYLPKGKKPLILSIDDLSYYSYMKNGGFADKLVLEDGVVKTEVLTPAGRKIVTDDGDVIPILDSFIRTHPDFSLNGAKGVIGLTGFEGILGYRTNWLGERGDSERRQAMAVVEVLKKTGWTFASHSFSHDQVFLYKTITPDFLAKDLTRWSREVEPLVGRTNIFIGPFGQLFSDRDPRRQQIIDAGFNVLYGVGMDGYTKFSSRYLLMDRIDIDGYRLTHDAQKLYRLFGLSVRPVSW